MSIVFNMATASGPKMPTTPSSTQSKKPADIDFEVEAIIGNLNREWTLGLPLPHEVEKAGSPEKRGKHKEQSCFNMIHFLVCKSQVYPTIREFRVDADILYIGWKNKPKAERGVVPDPTRNKAKPVSSGERTKLLHVLYTLLHDKAEVVKTQETASPRTWRQRSIDGTNPPTPRPDDRPVPFPNLKNDPKRAREENEPADDSKKSKRVKTPEKAEALATKSSNSMLPPPRGRPPVQDPKGWRSANTSFDSNATSEVFSNASQSFSRSRSRLPDTQETVPDLEELNFQLQPGTSIAGVAVTHESVPDFEGLEEDPSGATAQKESHTSSEFGVGSSFEAALAQTSDPVGLLQGSEINSTHVDDELSQDVSEFTIDPAINGPNGTISNEDILKERLDEIFRK